MAFSFRRKLFGAPPASAAASSGPHRAVLGLRSKLLLGFGGLLMVVLVVSLLAETVMDHYSRAIQRSYREDYDSVAACQGMKDAIGQLDLIAEETLWGRTAATAQVAGLRQDFERHLARQREAATLPGESAATEQLAARWRDYLQVLPQVLDPSPPVESRRGTYLDSVLPRSQQVRSSAQLLIDMNLASMLSVPGKAEAATTRAHVAMRTLTLSGLALAILFAGLIGRMILRPIRLLTNSVHEIERGNLELSIPVGSRDELGVLAAAFNTMAERLRVFRQIAHDRLVRTERTTQLAIDSLPDAVLVINPDGRIELANQVAQRVLGLMPGEDVHAPVAPWLAILWSRISDTGHAPEISGYESAIQVEIDGEIRYFLPRTAPILDEARRQLGATVVLADMTGLRRLDEMKNSLLSLVSHELKTPLTSARMVLHLVSEQKIGPLTPRQQDLLSAARDDTDQLHQIVENLLDMSRIESGRALMERQPIRPAVLVRRSSDPLASMAQNQQVELRVLVGEDLPEVLADAVRIGHVFANLVMNSLRHTPVGGTISITAAERGRSVEFTVSDTGSGIPRQYLHRIFEKFFRVPGQSGGTGSGLGLAIAKDIVEAHGGQIRIQSTDGAGTSIAFTVPVVEAAEPADEPGCLTSQVS